MKTMGRSILLGLTVLAFGASDITAQSMFRAGGLTSSLAGFGGAVVVNGNQVIVGEGGNNLRPGTVYLYEKQDGAWVETGTLVAPDAEDADGFGGALATDGDVLLVTGNNGVYGFTRAADGSWTPAGTIPAPQGVEGFGAALALSGTTAFVASPLVNERAGAVHVFDWAEGEWTQSAEITAPMPAEGEVFGAAVAFDGEYLFVGAPLNEERTGTVYAFGSENGEWVSAGQLTSGQLERNDQFGMSLATLDGMIAVGAAGHAGTGAVFTFMPGAEGWTESGRLVAFDGTQRAGFGVAVAINDAGIWVGAPGAGRGIGATYLFALDGMAIASSRRISPPADMSGRVQLGGALAGGAGFVALAAPGADNGAGTVVIYEGADDRWDAVASVYSPAEGFSAVTGEEVSCAEGDAAGWECSEVDLVSFVPVSTLAGADAGRGLRTNDNWGWRDPETGKLYALVGLTDRASFIDITDPVNPVVIGTLPMTEGANGSAWRDLKTYENHVYIVSDGSGQHGMQVFDLTRLRDFDGGEPVVFDADALYTNVASVHNIVINEATGFAFAVGASGGGETCGGGLHIIDIRDPKNPEFAGCFADPQTGRASTGYTHDAQCVVYEGPDADYSGREICFGANETALSIADVTDKDNTIAVSRAAYPSVGYSHQGWLTEDQSFFYLNDELDELQGTERTRTMIWDISDLDDPQLVAEHMGTQESSDHNLYVVGNLMYQSNYQSGLRILDITDPAAPEEVAYFDTVPYGDNGPGFGGSWSNYPFFENGVVIVTSGNEGLFLVRPTVRSTVFEN
jgi:choice-of-anchor B domain-containing protein